MLLMKKPLKLCMLLLLLNSKKPSLPFKKLFLKLNQTLLKPKLASPPLKLSSLSNKLLKLLPELVLLPKLKNAEYGK
jgi:hypothetical protein